MTLYKTGQAAHWPDGLLCGFCNLPDTLQVLQKTWRGHSGGRAACQAGQSGHPAKHGGCHPCLHWPAGAYNLVQGFCVGFQWLCPGQPVARPLADNTIHFQAVMPLEQDHGILGYGGQSHRPHRWHSPVHPAGSGGS